MSRVTHLLIDQVNVMRNTRVDQGHGRYLETPVVVYPEIAFRISSLTAEEERRADRLQSKATHGGYGEPDQDFRRGDILQPLTAPWVGSLFRVTGVIDPSKPHHRKLLLELIELGASA